MINDIEKTLAKMADEIPGVLTVALVTVNDGLAIAEVSRQEGFDSAEASAYLASIVKSNTNAIKLLAGDQVTEDILVTTKDYFFIIRQLPGYPFFIFIMTTRDSWLGKARVVMKEQDDHFQRFAKFLAENYLDNID